MLDFLLPKRIWVRHLIFWIALSVYFMMTDPATDAPAATFIGSAFLTANYALLYYTVGLYIFPTFWPARQGWFIFSLGTAFLVYVMLDGIAMFEIMPQLGWKKPAHYSYMNLVVADLLYFSVISVSAIAHQYSSILLRKEKEQNEKERLSTLKELNFLKSQFNTHITMNFLNFCYSNVHKTLPKTADAIELFADILRYTLKTKPDELILLSDEIEYINNYLNLQKLLTSKVYVNFYQIGNVYGKKILPRLFSTIIENAFKHGVFNDSDKPISITLEIKTDEILFSVENYKNIRHSLVPSNQHRSTGIGLNNLKDVLDIFYQNQYHLTVKNTEDIYACSIILKTA
jgi:two-component system, LytTR family, sensor kinase